MAREERQFEAACLYCHRKLSRCYLIKFGILVVRKPVRKRRAASYRGDEGGFTSAETSATRKMRMRLSHMLAEETGSGENQPKMENQVLIG